MFKCYECGHIFEQGEQDVWEEMHGLTYPPYERMEGCPACHGAFEEAEACEECGEWHFAGDLMSGLCRRCVDSYKNDVDTCFRVGGESLEEIEINSFLATKFSRSEIEGILFRELRKAHAAKPVDCSIFIDEDASWFAEKLKEKKKEVE